MTRLFKSEQSGRSMVEMLGVLAIIGVLSVAGIAGYSKAMAKYKVTKSIDQVSMLVANLRTIYAGQKNFSGLTTTVAEQIGAVSTDMTTATVGTLKNAFGGDIQVMEANISASDKKAFIVQYTGLGKDACATLAASDWGSGAQGGLLAISINGTKITTAPSVPTATSGSDWITAGLPVPPASAAALCAAASGDGVVWYYN